MRYIVGLGKTGLSVIHYLKSKHEEFICYDDSNLNMESTNLVKPEQVNWSLITQVIMSPGIPNSHIIYQLATQHQIPVICDIELFYQERKDSAQFIGITGTNGKSTTTALTAHILDKNAGGNIGMPILELAHDNAYIMEMSSYQLELIKDTRFDIAAITNITPDHLDRHGDMANYISAKKNIFKNAGHGVVSIDNPITMKIFEELQIPKTPVSAEKILANGVSMLHGNLYINGTPNEIGELKYMKGRHNAENIVVAAGIALQYGINISDIIKKVSFFKGLEHRMQYLGEANGVAYINDSKATNADATSNALQSYDNIRWIIGGVAKEGGIESLHKYFGKIKKAYLIGASASDFLKFLQNKLEFALCGDLKSAFELANSEAEKGDVILLSPACASFDQWKNFEERGKAFQKMFESIK